MFQSLEMVHGHNMNNFLFKIEADNNLLVLNENLYESKKALFEMFYGDFYDFILNHNGQSDLDKNNIKSKEDFYKYADFYAGGMENCYAMGFNFHKYFLTVEEGGALNNQPVDTFIGYLYHNNKYLDFLNFLISFFAYWRNDEGCTSFNPYNHADDFFNSSWAALVDTTKLFYFSSETVYHWHSYRIKYLLDHIPGVILEETLSNINKDDLKKVHIAGYEFIGWYENDKKIKKTNNLCNVVLKLKRKDFYNYWEREFPKIPKVITKEYKKVDPA